MIKKCYFFNVGTTFDKNNLDCLYDVWNYNSNCCKSDLCNGFYCENYGINFNKDKTIKEIEKYVNEGVINTYGYIKSVDIDLPEEVWKYIYQNLVKNYKFSSIKEATENGFISFDFGDIIDDYSSYWEEPDQSFLKIDANKIIKDGIHVLKEDELNPETIKWINSNLYSSEMELEL